ncbi:NAD(P)/FAD-dependent oxidoreductase [Aquimarina sp. RZ0]|uniref:flavin-containing monooxygenase n=1 Tax=Aquimarina sp. RZ0 TaxID=2607730 RepID=UPI0011F1AC79|nr:NAD(P)-binding domain-containing protein [Aquimarina sp. RZ0]KAA1246821.1 SidA/IucD/PvdA family monooxygenase [Aquimarina sp. RZ0]
MYDCIIIGAGPSGIVAIKELIEQGITNILCLEKSLKLGGTFSQAYDNLKLTSSTTFSMFSDFWVGDNGINKFWTKDEAVEYWSDYSKNFEADQHIRYKSNVTKIESIGDNDLGENGWKVSLESENSFLCKRVILAIGNNRIPKYPNWKSELQNINFVHSKSYKNAIPYRGKRVLIVGGGESGSDIALEVSKVAQKCWVSLRNSTGWVVPRKRGDVASDNSTHRAIWNLPLSHGTILSRRLIKRERSQNKPIFNAVVKLNSLVTSKYGIRGIYGTKTLALPKAMANYGCEIVREVITIEQGGKKIHTSDGKILEDIDFIIFSTGYENSKIEMLPKELQKTDPRNLYKHMINPLIEDRFIWLGWVRAGFGSQFPIIEMQARLASLIISKKHKLPPLIEMECIISKDKAENLERFQENAYRIRSLVDYHNFMDDMAEVIGCTPPLTKYFFRNIKLWIKLVFGPTQSTQFRLKGPGQKNKQAIQIINKLPEVRLNKVIKEGIKGRIRYSFKSFIKTS